MRIKLECGHVCFKFYYNCSRNKESNILRIKHAVDNANQFLTISVKNFQYDIHIVISQI